MKLSSTLLAVGGAERTAFMDEQQALIFDRPSQGAHALI